MVAVQIETYDYDTRSHKFIGPSDTPRSEGVVVEFRATELKATETVASAEAVTYPLAAGLYDQELSEAASAQLEQVIQGRLGIPTRPDQDLPQGDLSKLLNWSR